MAGIYLTLVLLAEITPLFVGFDSIAWYNAFVNVICVKYRILPTKAQETALESCLSVLRDVYNSLVNERTYLYETQKQSISQYAQEKHFTDWKEQFPELKTVHTHLLQNVALRVNLAFTAFFRRVKAGELQGYPRLKGKGSYDSFTFKEYGNGCKLQGDVLQVSKIGQVRCIVHRPLIGKVKTCTIRRRAGKWFACFACEYEPVALPPSAQSVGIDVGLNQFAALATFAAYDETPFRQGDRSLSDDFFVDNPRFFRKDEKALAKAGRKQSKTKRGSVERRKANKVLSRIHERIRNRRHDFVHQTSRRLVNRFGLIAVEKLNVKGMVQNHCLAKSISDAAWSLFRSVLSVKAESAGRKIVEVNPAYTSQDCSGCGYRAKKKLSERWHFCPMCSLSLDRDTNAAINILQTAMGLHSVSSLTAVEAPVLRRNEVFCRLAGGVVTQQERIDYEETCNAIAESLNQFERGEYMTLEEAKARSQNEINTWTTVQEVAAKKAN